MIYVLVFIVGFCEYIIDVFDFKVTQKNKALQSALLAYLGIWFWWFFIRVIIEDIDNIFKVNNYALGCAVGTYLVLKLWKINQD